MKTKSLVMGFVIILTGCTAMPSQQEMAKNGQWQALGVRDGQMGWPVKGAADLGELVDEGDASDGQAVSQYRAGYRQGLTQFCQSDSAYFSGLSGREYHGQCDRTRQSGEVREQWQNGLDDYFLGMITDFES